MSWTYATLSTAIQDYLQSSETTLLTNIPVIVQQAEDRILKTVQLPAFRKNCSGTLTGSNQYLAVPTGFLSPYSLAVNNSGFEYLIFKDVNFIREAYPVISTKGTPKYYSLYSDAYFLVGPTPDTGYSVEIHYFYKPESIVTASTSWLGTNAESTLFYGCLLEAYTFQKGDADMVALTQARYEDALAGLMLLADGRSTTDNYRSA